jgi:predicted DNA-binding protein with PD1-like motif
MKDESGMRAVRNGAYWQLRLMPGEEIIATLAEFVRSRRIKSGFLTAIGAAEDITLGCFDPKKRVYHKRTFRGDCEVAALVGNVAWDGRNPLCHIHAVISTPRLTTFAGHLFSGKVTVTLEVALVPGARRLTRRPDPFSGLKLLHLPALKPA